MYKRIDITIDKETEKIFELFGEPKSQLVRKALKNYIRFNKPTKSMDGVDITYDE